MRATTVLTGFASALFAVSASAVTFDGPITNIDGRMGPQYTGAGSADVRLRYRPWAASLDRSTLTLNNILIHDVKNQKGIDIGPTINPDGSIWTYSNVIVSNYENVRDVRTIAGLHIDGIRITGAGNLTKNKTNVTLDDIWVHDGSTLPINLQDGMFGTITLRNIRIDGNDLNQLQIATINSGHVDHIIVENCPGLNLALMGATGSIGDVKVYNSPGINLGDMIVKSGRSGAKITYYSSVPVVGPVIPSTGGSGTVVTAKPPTVSGGAAVPEPSSLGIALVGGLMMAKRRRKAA